jgi:glycosyltransferase involved in cell wall biosynthesis
MKVQNPINIAVCVPLSWDKVDAEFMKSMLHMFRPNMLNEMQSRGIRNYWNLWCAHFPLDYNRNVLVKKAMEIKADYILFLDADMTFKPETLIQLFDGMKNHRRAGIVSGLYFKKGKPFYPVPGNFKNKVNPQVYYPIHLNGNRYIPADVVGMGAAFIRVKALADIEPPYFEYERDNITREMRITEDISFCKKMKKAGWDILVDTECICGHNMMITVDEVLWKSRGEPDTVATCYCAFLYVLRSIFKALGGN